MPFDLRIRFGGLVMFAAEAAKVVDGHEQPARMHVLLPAVPAMAAPGPGHRDPAVVAASVPGGEPDGISSTRGTRPQMEPHFAWIVYDKAYEKPAQSQLSGVLELLSLDHRALNLLGLSELPIDPSLPDLVCDLGSAAGELPPGTFGPAPGAGLLGRITMDSGMATAAGLVSSGRAEHAARMAMWTEWTIRGIPGDRLSEQTLAVLDGGARGVLPELFPIGHVVRLNVVNSPAGDVSVLEQRPFVW